jgi:hypothetical protein
MKDVCSSTFIEPDFRHHHVDSLSASIGALLLTHVQIAYYRKSLRTMDHGQAKPHLRLDRHR